MMLKHRYRTNCGRLSGAGILLGLIGLGILGVLYPAVYYTSKTIHDLLSENSHLKENISRLTAESQIGYAKVLEQFERDGKRYTRLLFVETEREDPRKTILKRECEIEGDIVHFDAMIVKFRAPLVMEGQERAIYLWRRIYGEHMKPEDGYPIEEPGREPLRYRSICHELSLDETKLFWEEIWKLSNNPDQLHQAGIQAVYGNVVYQNLQSGLIYIFKIGDTGDLYIEVIPDL